MICPNCSAEYEDFHLFCHHCGCALPQPEEPQITEEAQGAEVLPAIEPEAVAEEDVFPDEPQLQIIEPALPVTPPPRGRHWPAAAIMAFLVALGIFLFYMMPKPQAEPLQTDSCYIIHDGVLDFYEYYYTGGSSLTVPETVNGQTVTALADYCFVDCDSLTEIILPDTLESIGDYAFADCSNLRGIFIPERVTGIGEGAFEDCSALEAISIPASVTEIGEDAFDYCVKLQHLFYSGKAGDWQALYSEYINGEVTVYSDDIPFSHDG